MAGTPTFATPPGFLGLTRADPGAAFVVAGVPLDIGTTNRAGTRDGPAAIRRASRMLTDGAHPEHWVEPAALVARAVTAARVVHSAQREPQQAAPSARQETLVQRARAAMAVLAALASTMWRAQVVTVALAVWPARVAMAVLAARVALA